MDNADASLVTAYDNCAVILSGKRVGFTINPEQWVHKTVPYDIEKILISSILWASYGSTNEDCSDRLPAPSSFVVSYPLLISQQTLLILRGQEQLRDAKTLV